MVIDCFTVTGVTQGAAVYSYAFLADNLNDDNTITVNLSNSVCKSLSGTAGDVAACAQSTTTNNAIINAYMCTFDGADFDVKQTNSNVFNVGGSVLVNKKVSGTVTYRATMTSGELLVSGTSDLNDVNTVNLYVEGLLGQRTADFVSNANDINSDYVTSKAMKVYDKDGTFIGYVPVYQTQW